MPLPPNRQKMISHPIRAGEDIDIAVFLLASYRRQAANALELLYEDFWSYTASQG